MTRTLPGLVLALALFAVHAGGAAAQDLETRLDELFTQLDRNGDGRLTADEIDDDHRRLFERALRLGDADGDGILTRDEFINGLSQTGARAPAHPEVPRRDVGPLPERRPGFDPERLFELFDRNEDGRLTLDELPAPVRERLRPHFEAVGLDALTRNDLLRAQERLRPPAAGPAVRPAEAARHLFDRLDADGDGRLTLDEVPEEARPIVERIFERAEKDPGDALTREEFERLAPPGRGGPASGREPRGRRPFRLPPLFEKLDQDGDGRISREEFSRVVELFDELDANGDGYLDLRELFGFPPAE